MATPIDLGEMLEMLTLAEKSAREGREAVCVKRQLDAQGKTLASGLVLAGTSVLNRIQNGDASVAKDVQGKTPEQAAHDHAVAQITGLANQSVANLINCAGALKAMLEKAGAAG